MDVIVSIIVLISILVSALEKVDKANKKNKTPQRQRGTDWKRAFQETPSKLERSPTPTSAPTTKPQVKKAQLERAEPKTVGTTETVSAQKKATKKTISPVVLGVKDFEDWDQDFEEESRAPIVKKVAVKKTTTEKNLLTELATDRDALARAVIAKELFGKPRALNPWQAR